MTVFCSRQSSQNAAPERAEEKQLYDLCPDAMAPYCLLSRASGSLRTPDFIPHAPSLLLYPPSCIREADNEQEEVGKCIIAGFSLII